jgi:hypothetical protein
MPEAICRGSAHLAGAIVRQQTATTHARGSTQGVGTSGRGLARQQTATTHARGSMQGVSASGGGHSATANSNHTCQRQYAGGQHIRQRVAIVQWHHRPRTHRAACRELAHPVEGGHSATANNKPRMPEAVCRGSAYPAAGRDSEKTQLFNSFLCYFLSFSTYSVLLS